MNRRIAVVAGMVLCWTAAGRAPIAAGQEATPKAELMESPGIRVLTGLTVPEFDAEMKGIVASLGVNCGYCHVRGNFASDANPHKIEARRMLEMTRLINQQFFADYAPAPGESRLGKVTCYTCHQGATQPKAMLGVGE